MLRRFNVNNKVRVRLTGLGRRIHQDNHREFWASVKSPNPPAYVSPTVDADGWSEWHLWTLMSEFGQHMQMGKEVPFETEMLIDLEDEGAE